MTPGALLLAAAPLILGAGAILAAALLAQGGKELHQWLPWLATRLIRRSVRLLPASNRDRYEEEWLAEMETLPAQGFTSLFFAIRVALRAPRTGRVLRERSISPVSIRLWDAALSGCFLVALAPILLAFILLVRLSDGGPAFVRHMRRGRFSTLFPQLAFRTGPTFSGSLLKRYGFDLLPSFYNVIRGDMGIIGPPPFRSDLELGEDNPLFRYFADGGRPGLVSWLALAISRSDDHDTCLQAMKRDARMLAGWNLLERTRLMLAALWLLISLQIPRPTYREG